MQIKSPLAERIYATYKPDPPRPHLGASLIGHECDRYIWLKFRWAVDEVFPGQLLRVFETGVEQEKRMIKNLRDSGHELLTEAWKGWQYGFQDFGGHFAGMCDGVIRGVSQAPEKWHLWECKTINDKGFKGVQKNGIQEARPRYYAQVITYMDYLELTRCLFTVINKNDESILEERIHANHEIAEGYKLRARRLIEENGLPPKLSENPAWFQCKMCGLHGFCFGDMKANKNCRTCLWSAPLDTNEQFWSLDNICDPEVYHVGRWGCSKYGVLNEQIGCLQHEFIEGLEK